MALSRNTKQVLDPSFGQCTEASNIAEPIRLCYILTCTHWVGLAGVIGFIIKIIKK